MALYGGIELPDQPDLENVRKLDALPVPMIRQMQRYGFRIDPEHFHALSSRLQSRMADLRCEILNEIPAESLDRFIELSDWDNGEDSESESSGVDADVTPPEFQVESGRKVAELLYDVLHLDRTHGVKVKKTKGGDRLSTGKKTLEQLKREHPVVPLILEYRENSKLDGTYARSMPRKAKLHPKGTNCPQCSRMHYTDEWRIHTQILSTRTATGRLASKSPNLQNIPTRTKLGQEIRAGFIASEGHVIPQRDFAQIELRLLADRSGDTVMLDVYSRDGDIHLETAMRAFSLPADRIDKLLHRAPAKNVNFAVAYLITGAGLLDLMAVTFATAGLPLPEYMTEAWCDAFIQTWFGIYSGVRSYLDDEESKIRRLGIAWTAMGRVRRIPAVRSCHSYIQEAAVREGGNHGIQGYSADLMRLAMGELHERLERLRREYGIEAWPLLSIHDELLIETEEDHGELIETVLEEVMDNVLVDRQTGRSHCKVPIQSDGKILTRWEK